MTLLDAAWKLLSATPMTVLGSALALLSGLAAFLLFYATRAQWRALTPDIARFDAARAACFGFAWLSVGSLVAVLRPNVWGEWHGLAPVVIWLGWVIAALMYCWSQYESYRGTHPLQRRNTGEVQRL